MKTLSLHEVINVSGGQEMALGGAFLAGMAMNAIWNYMRTPSNLYLMKEELVQTDVQNPLYNANGQLTHYEVVTYGEYVPVYTKWN